MTWPTALTVDGDITTYVFEQGITRILESGDFSALHTGVATEIRNWLEANSITDADAVTNTAAFTPAAANLFVSKVFANRDKELSTYYRLEYLRMMRNTRAELPEATASTGGTIAEVVVIKQSANYFTRKRSGQVFQPRRN